MASYPSTAQSSDFVNAVPTGLSRSRKKQHGENLEETQKHRCFEITVFFSLQIKMGENGERKLAAKMFVQTLFQKCFVFDSETLLLCTQRMTAT